MPVYTYSCGKCNRSEDYLVSMGEVPSGCSHCGSPDLNRVMHGQTFSPGASSKRNSGAEGIEAKLTIFRCAEHKTVIGGILEVREKVDPSTN